MLPRKFEEEMKELLKEEYDKYLASFEEKPISSIRINEEKVKDFLKISPF